MMTGLMGASYTMDELNAHCGGSTTNPGHHRVLAGGPGGDWDCSWWPDTAAIGAADQAATAAINAKTTADFAAGNIAGWCSDAWAAQQGFMQGLKDAAANGFVIIPLPSDSNPWGNGHTTDAKGAACTFDVNKAGSTYKLGLYAPTALAVAALAYFLFGRKGK